MRKVVREAVAVAVVGASVASAADAEWPWWRGPNRDGKSRDTGLLKQWPAGGRMKLWQADDIGRGFSTVAIKGGTIYTTGDAGGKATTEERRGRRRVRVTGGKLFLFAFDMNGKLKWKQEIDNAWTRSHQRITPST